MSMEYKTKRNYSDISDSSTTSPAAYQPSKSCWMSQCLDTYFIHESARLPNNDVENEVLEEQLKSLSMEEKMDSIYKMMRAQQVKTNLDVKSLQMETNSFPMY